MRINVKIARTNDQLIMVQNQTGFHFELSRFVGNDDKYHIRFFSHAHKMDKNEQMNYL